MASLLRDARYAVRLLRRNPGFTIVAVSTLALGIAATTAIFSVVYGLFFAPLPYDKADRLVMLWEYRGDDRSTVTAKTFVEWKQQATAFIDVNAWSSRRVNLATSDRPESVTAGISTPGFLAMLGYGHPLALGRTFRDDEGVPGRNRVVILTWEIWQDRFGGDAAIVGRQVRVDDVPHTVVGVLGRGPADRQQNKIWLPLAFDEQALQLEYPWLLVMARLKDNVSVSQADASLVALGARLERERPRPRPNLTARVEAFRNDFVTDATKRGVWLLLGAVMFVLLIACVNVANLLLARGTVRQRELAIRAAIGATPGSVARQLLVESVILALTGGVLGAVLASAIVGAIVALMPPFTLPSETEITLSIPVLLFAFAACTAAGVAAGLVPAWQGSRTSAAESMKDGGRTIGDRRFGLRRALVVAEFALALTLLSGGGMAVHALVRTMTVDPGFRAEHLTTFELPVPFRRFTTPEQVRGFYASLSERVGALPGVAWSSVSTGKPVSGPEFANRFEIVGQPVADPSARPRAGVNMVSPSYHSTFGIPIRRGRTFDAADRDKSRPVAIVNEAFVARYLPERDPIGQRLIMTAFSFVSSQEPAVEWEIVGVQGDAVNAGRGRPAQPEIVVPFDQLPWPRTIVSVRTSGVALPQSAIAGILRTLDPTLPMANIQTIEQTLSESTASDRFYTVFFAAFAGVALLLAAVGIYGVMSFAVARRTHEIGLRIALGGGRTQVLGQVLREGMATALGGTLLGAAGAVLMGGMLEGAIYGVEPANPMTFAAVAVTLLLAALLARLVPARRAAAVDPMVALRQS